MVRSAFLSRGSRVYRSTVVVQDHDCTAINSGATARKKRANQARLPCRLIRLRNLIKSIGIHPLRIKGPSEPEPPEISLFGILSEHEFFCNLDRLRLLCAHLGGCGPFLLVENF